MRNYTYNDVHIGDTVILNNGISGEIVEIKSIAFINNQLIPLNDETIHTKGIIKDDKIYDNRWYGVVTIYVVPENSISYYESIEFKDIKNILPCEKSKNIFTKFINIFK